MTQPIIKEVITIGVIGLAVAWAANNRELIYAQIGLTPSTPHTQTVEDINTPPPPQKSFSGSVVSIPKNKQDGQYWADARVNSGYVKFLVDTGASSVALTLTDAKKAGIRTRDLTYNVPISTAGGRNYAAAVKINSIAVGGISLKNINALIVKDGLHVSLLGMSYLGKLQKVEATPSSLILRL